MAFLFALQNCRHTYFFLVTGERNDSFGKVQRKELNLYELCHPLKQNAEESSGRGKFETD